MVPASNHNGEVEDERDLSLPPHSVQAEEAVLGSVLKHPASLDQVSDFLRAEDFYQQRNKQVFRAMLALLADRQPIDYATIADELTRQGTYEQAGGSLYLSQINLATPTSSHIEHYGRIVERTSLMRQLIARAQAIAEMAYRDNLDPDTALEKAEQLILSVAEARPGIGISIYPEPEDRSTATLSAQGGVEYVEDLLGAGRIVVGAAEEGTGKSYAISGELGIRLACAGGSFAETWPVTTKCNVVVLSEMHTDEDFAREDVVLASLGLERNALATRYFRLPLMTAANGAPPLDDAAWRRWFVGWCREHEVVCAIFDTATGATEAEPWGAPIRAVYRNLRVLIEEYPELAIVLIVHCKKPQAHTERRISDVIGEWGRWCDVILMLERQGETRVKLSSWKRVRTQRRVTAEQRGGLLVDPIDISGRTSARKVSDADFLGWIEQRTDSTYAQLADHFKLTPRTAQAYCKRLGDELDEWTEPGGHGEKHVFRRARGVPAEKEA
jgi:hypothetical protein